MNLLNRIIVILVILVLMLVIPLVLVFPEQAQAILRTAADIIQANVDWLNSLTPSGQIGVRLMLAGVGFVVFCIGVVFLVLEVVRLRRRSVRLRDGSAEVVMDGVSEHLSYYVDLLPDVIRVQPSVQSTGKSVQAMLYVDTAPGVNVPEKSQQIQQTATDVLENQLGLKVKGEVKVVVRPVPYPKGQVPAPVSEPPAEAEHEVVEVKAPAEEA
jgi:uncharacterized alkaline shock family protein YloU